MIESIKPIASLTIGDLRAFPVWQFTSRESADEPFVRPVKSLPVTSLIGKVIGTQITLANGKCAWAIIGNVDPKNPRMTEHFLTLSIERNGHWFMLARYHDPDYDESGPEALAQFLGLAVDDVFPISYDIRSVAKGEEAAMLGIVQKRPQERLSRSELIAMAVP